MEMVVGIAIAMLWPRPTCPVPCCHRTCGYRLSSDPGAAAGPTNISSVTPNASSQVPLPKVAIPKPVIFIDPFCLVCIR